MQRGTVSWYSKDKGYGFITPEAGGSDIAVYADAVEAAGAKFLKEGQAVRFETEPYKKVLKAARVEIETQA